MNSAQVGVFEETNEVGLGSLLDRHQGRALETHVHPHFDDNFTDEALEWKLADEEFGSPLISTNLSQSDRSWSVPVRFLDTTYTVM